MVQVAWESRRRNKGVESATQDFMILDRVDSDLYLKFGWRGLSTYTGQPR